MSVWSPWIAIVATLLAAVFGAMRSSLLVVSKSALSDRTANGNGNGDDPPTGLELISADLPGHARAVALPSLALNLVIAVAIIAWVSGLVDGGGQDEAGVAAATGIVHIGLGGLLIGTAVAAAWLWVFAIVVPSSLGNHVGAGVIRQLAPLIRTIYTLERPVRAVAQFIDEVIRRLSGATEVEGAEAIEAEILSVIDEGEREGKIDESERDMIEAVVEFRSTTVEQIMTPRTEIDALEATDDLAEILAFARQIGHSRIPVYEGDMDHVLGVLYAKDLLPWIETENDGFKIRDVLRPAGFVPESKTVRDLLSELIDRKVHLVLVADEYGGTSGLVTVEDIVEEIVGEIRDEYEPEDETPPQIDVDPDARTAEADARAYIDDVNDALEPLGFALPEDDDYDTLGGFVITALGRIPEPGERFTQEGTALTVLEATPTRVVRMRLEIGTDEEPAPDEAPSDDVSTDQNGVSNDPD